MVRKYCWLLFYLFLVLFIAGADVTIRKVSIPRKMQLFLGITGDFTDAEKILLQESLLIQLSESKDLLVLEPVILAAMPEETMNSVVKQAAGDCWLQIGIGSTAENITIKAVSYDLLSDQYIIKDMVLEKDHKIRGITRGFWRDIYQEIAAGYKATEELREVDSGAAPLDPGINIIPSNKGIKVSIGGLPGTVLTGVGKERLVIGAEGRIDVEVAGYSTYKLRASKPGYYPVKVPIYLTDQEKSIELKQQPGSVWGGDLYLQHIDYPGLSALYYPLPNTLFLELGAVFYQFKLMFTVSENAELYSLPLTHIFLNAGYYLMPTDSIIRLYLSTGVFIRIMGLGDNGIGFDPLSSWGLKFFAVNAEVLLHKNFKPFFEYGCLFYFTRNGMMMKASLTDVDEHLADGYIFMNKLVIDLVHIRAGIRIQFP